MAVEGRNGGTLTPFQPDRNSQGPKSVPGATGSGMAATVPGRNPHTGAAQGALVRHPRGSNGGVHRGPDLQLRINATRGLVLEALAREGILLVIPAKGKK